MVIQKHVENTNNEYDFDDVENNKNIFNIKYIVFLTLCIFVCSTKLQRIVYIFKACALFTLFQNDRSVLAEWMWRRLERVYRWLPFHRQLYA